MVKDAKDDPWGPFVRRAARPRAATRGALGFFVDVVEAGFAEWTRQISVGVVVDERGDPQQVGQTPEVLVKWPDCTNLAS
jgi:hypothetical protein